MSPDKTSKDTGRVWGKRPRDSGGPQDGHDAKSFVRFSNLSPKEKLQRRKTERIEKKERDRTMSYFISVQRAIEECVHSGGDATLLTGIIDGFFVELMKLLKADRSFHLLRNAKICRVIETALRHAPLLHCKSLLYVFLGRLAELTASPVASYTVEALFVALSRGLRALAGDAAALAAELAEDGPGAHAEGGVPPTAALLRAAAEEWAEAVEGEAKPKEGSKDGERWGSERERERERGEGGGLLSEVAAARALRAVLRALAQSPARAAPAVGTLAAALVAALEGGGGEGGEKKERDRRAANERTKERKREREREREREEEEGGEEEAAAWAAAARAPAPALLLQGLLEASGEGAAADLAVRQRLEALRLHGRPLLRELLCDPVGVHVFQAYLRVPPPAAVIAAGDRIALAQRPETLPTAAKRPQRERPDEEVAEGSEEQLLEECCWGKAMRLTQSELGQLLGTGSERIAQTGYVLQDLVLYSPTATHLQLLWREILEPNLSRFTEIHALGGVLTALLRKCAFSGLLVAPSEGEGATNGATSPHDLITVLQQEEEKGVRYFSVPLSFEQLVTKELCTLFKSTVPKGAAQYLLVDQRLGERGYELARYILHLRHPASVLLRHGIDKLRLEDVLNICKHHKGSLVLQQYLRASSSAQTSAKSHTPRAQNSGVNGGTKHAENETAAESAEKGEVVRFFRRIQGHIADLVGDKYAAFVVEVLYEVASIGLKEAIVKALIPIYEALKATSRAEVQDEEFSKDAPSQSFISRKVLNKCCVEQYIYRNDDWKKMTQVQCRVQKLLRSIVLDG